MRVSVSMSVLVYISCLLLVAIHCTTTGNVRNCSSFSRSMSMDHTKPLIVPAGADALGQIGQCLYVAY